MRTCILKSRRISQKKLKQLFFVVVISLTRGYSETLNLLTMIILEECSKGKNPKTYFFFVFINMIKFNVFINCFTSFNIF